ncbi:MAG: ABC transporter ATP-binding protein [Leptospirales bacterium]|jgi:lipopolysaccharide transport system ATP-binding protein
MNEPALETTAVNQDAALDGAQLAVGGLGKRYRGFGGFHERVFSALSLGLYGGSQSFPALSDLNFAGGAGGRGEIIGVIGPNGAGKSTLLRILSGVSRPDAGRAETRGTIRSVLELGVGFSPDLSGRENVYYNGRLWGYRPRQLLEAMDSIFAFARLSDYIDRPFGTYSTGMQMRLGFALATFERSEILLIDEALAVGDASFQQRCIRRFEQFRDAGSVILVVSHDMYLMQHVCDRLLLLDRGRLVMDGEPKAVVGRYMNLLAEQSFERPANRMTTEEYRVRLLDAATDRERPVWISGEAARVAIELSPREDLADVTIGIHISDRRGVQAFGVNSRQLGCDLNLSAGRATRLEYNLAMNLGPGLYTLGMSVHRGLTHTSDCYLWEDHLVDFEVETPAASPFIGMSFLEPRLRIVD